MLTWHHHIVEQVPSTETSVNCRQSVAEHKASRIISSCVIGASEALIVPGGCDAALYQLDEPVIACLMLHAAHSAFDFCGRLGAVASVATFH